MARTQALIKESSQVMLVKVFSTTTMPPFVATNVTICRARSCTAADSWTSRSCKAVFVGKPSRASGVRTGFGPFGLRVAMECFDSVELPMLLPPVLMQPGSKCSGKHNRQANRSVDQKSSPLVRLNRHARPSQPLRPERTHQKKHRETMKKIHATDPQPWHWRLMQLD